MRMLATFRPSRHVQMVWHVTDMSSASCASNLWNLENDMHDILVTSYQGIGHVREDATRQSHVSAVSMRMSRGCYGKLFPWNLGLYD